MRTSCTRPSTYPDNSSLKSSSNITMSWSMSSAASAAYTAPAAAAASDECVLSRVKQQQQPQMSVY